MEDNNELELPAYVELHATRNNPDSVLNTIDTFSVKETRLKWMMNISVPKGFVLDEQVHRALSKAPVDPNRGHVFVEMGCYIGYSTIRIARHFKALNKKATLYSFDPDKDAVAITSKLLQFAGLDNYVRVINGKVADELPRHFSEERIQKVDFVFIDHEKTDYLTDFELLENLALFQTGCVIMADNLLYPGSGDFYYYVRTNQKFKSRLVISQLEYHDFEDALLISEYIG